MCILYLWSGAAAGASIVQVKSALGVPVGHAMLKNFETLAPGDSLSRAVRITLQGSSKDYPVLDVGEVVVASALQDNVLAVDSREMLKGSLAGLGASDPKTVLATHSGELVDVLTEDNVGELA